MPQGSGTATLDQVAKTIRELFPDTVATAVTDPATPSEDLLPDETAAIANAVEKRRREFAAGRRAARLAMSTLGMPQQPVLSGPDRAPIWPFGMTGSISHTSSHCVACVTSVEKYHSLGVDIEDREPLEASLLDIVCVPEEQDWLKQQPLSERGRLAKLLYSVKESAYKCQYPLTGQILDFAAFSVSLDAASNSFAAIFTETVGSFHKGHRLNGKFANSEGLVLTGVTIGK